MNRKLSSFLWYSAIVLTVLLTFIGVSVLATAGTGYQPIITSNHSLSATVFATDGTTTMDVELIDGRLHVSDSVHGVKNLRVLESMLVNRLKGYNGKEIMLYHVNDAGVKDSSRLVPIKSDGTWTYFYDVEFSEIIIDGYVGTWEVTAYNLSVSDSLNLGQEMNGSTVEYVHVDVTDDATKSDPYDINTTGCVLEWRADGNFNDTQGVNTLINHDVLFDNGKYNEAGVFNSSNFSYVDCGNDDSLDITDAITIEAWVKPGSLSDTGYILTKYKALGSEKSYALRQANDKISFILSSDGTTRNTTTVTSLSSIGTNFNHVVGTWDGTTMYLYINGNQDLNTNTINTIFTTTISVRVGSRTGANFFTGSIDDIRVYNRALLAAEIQHNYYDHLQQLQIKTNTNATYSTEWNSTANNPIQVPYGAGELFSILNFTVPDTVIQNGITIYDYPSTVQLDAVATIGYTEDTTKITEEATTGTYTLNVTHAAVNTGEGYINYTTTNAVLLDANFWNAAVLTSDNPNATLSTTLPDFSISTGYVAATTEYYYLVEQDYFYPPTNIQTIPSQCCVNITWDAVPNADNYSVYELEDGFPYVDTEPIVDGVKDAIYDCAHEFLIFSPNPVNPGDYETIYPLRTSLGAYFLIESVDNDDRSGDDDTIYYLDLDNNGLTTNDYAWKITDNIVKRYHWDGASWKVSGGSSAVGASTGAGTHYPIHELFIPITELGANWTNGSTVKVLVKREDSSLTPDVITWYPYGNINDTDTSLWQEMVLNDPDSYTFLGNTTNLWYNATGLTPFTIYHGGVSAWNGSQETSHASFDVITDDIPFYSVSGYIENQDGNPLPDITVYSCNGFISEVTTTNESGYWIGYAFREGNYTICANSTCYIANSIDIHVTDNMTNQNITLNNVIINNCELMEKLLEIEDSVTPNSTVPETTPPENAMPLSLFITWDVIMFIMLFFSVPRHDDYDNLNIGIQHIFFGLIATTIAYVLSKQIINGQVVQTFSGISQINTVVITTQSVQISWLSYVLQFIGIAAFILTMILILAFINEHFMKEIEDEEVI